MIIFIFITSRIPIKHNFIINKALLQRKPPDFIKVLFKFLIESLLSVLDTSI